jgi:hypothetical protein
MHIALKFQGVFAAVIICLESFLKGFNGIAILKTVGISVENLYRQAGFVAAVFYTTVKNKFVGVIGDYNFAS